MTEKVLSFSGSTMEDTANSPILINSDDEDDDVVLVKEEKGAVHVAAQEKQGNDESDEDVIFVAQEPRQSNKKTAIKVSLGQHNSGASKTNVNNDSSRRDSESSDDDTFVLPQMKTVPSMSSISLINDILRPLDLSQSHLMPKTGGRNSPSHTCSSIDSSKCCPLKHSVCSEHLHKVQTGSTNTSTQAASLQTTQMMICPKPNADETSFSQTSPLCSVVLDSSKICPSPDDSSKEAQECPDNSFMASSLETSAAKVDLSFETKDIKSSGKMDLDSSGTSEKLQSAFEVSSSKASLEKGDLNPGSSSSNSDTLQCVTKADSVGHSSEKSASSCCGKDSDHKSSDRILSGNLGTSTTKPMSELSEKIKLDVDNIDKDEWSSLLAFLSDISPEEISPDNDNRNKEKVGECSKQNLDSALLNLSQGQTTSLPATVSTTPVLGIRTKDVMSPEVTSTNSSIEKQFSQAPLQIKVTDISTPKNRPEKGNSSSRLQETQQDKDKETRLLNKPVDPQINLLSVPKVEQTSVKASTSKDDGFQMASVFKNQNQSSLSKKDKVIDRIATSAEHQAQTTCAVVSSSKSKASYECHSLKVKRLKMVRFHTTVDSYQKTCSGLKSTNREIQSLFSRNEAVDKNQEGTCGVYKISPSEKGEMCKKFIRTHSAPTTSDASSSFISGKSLSRSLDDTTSHASDIISVSKSNVIDSRSTLSDFTSSKQDRAIAHDSCSPSCAIKSSISSASQSFSNPSCGFEKAGPSTAMQTCDNVSGTCSYKPKKKMARLYSTLVPSGLQTDQVKTSSVVFQMSACDPKTTVLSKSVALSSSSTKSSTLVSSVKSSDPSRDDRQQKSHWSKVTAPESRDTCLKRQHSMTSVHHPKHKATAKSFHRSVSDNDVHKSGVDVSKSDAVDAKGELTQCTKCASPQRTENLSRCMLGHVICQLCLESQVKAILTGNMKQKNIKCPEKFCFEILTFEELKKTLPQFVVDILEEKLDKEYLGYITKWMFTDDSQLKSRSEFATSDSRTPPCPAVNMRKYEEIYSQESRDTSEDLPTFWAPMERGAPVTVYEVAPETDEYTALAVQFHDSLRFPEHDIVRIIRVQNPILWKYFALKRSEMVQDNEGMDVAETQLYHGTHRSSLEAIARKGFDWRLSGKHGTVYGCGSYFARDAGYSHGYTDCGGSSISVKNTGHKRGLLTSHLLNPFCANLRSVSSGFFLSQPPPPPPLPLYAPPPPPPAHSHFPLPPPAHGQKPQGFDHMPMLQLLLNPWPPTCSQAQATSSCAKANDDAFFSQRNANPSKSTTKPLPNSSSASSENTHRRNEKGSQDLAAAFTRSSNSQTHFMFVARVLVGRHTGGSSDLKRPPPLDKNYPFGKSYDSCVDNIFSPRVFVVFDNNQAYPEYIIEYTWERNT